MRDVISFGQFRLFPTERLLERNGACVQIGGQSLDILVCQAECAGEVISKREVFVRVWAGIY